ncbi:MAG: ferritin-like domain-containing protein [Magnetococcus sp. WYHC-3]
MGGVPGTQEDAAGATGAAADPQGWGAVAELARQALATGISGDKLALVAELEAQATLLPPSGAARLARAGAAPAGMPPLTWVDPRHTPRRNPAGSRGRLAHLHALAHIEFVAINLALDAALRFAGLPDAYYVDWLVVAADEARHFRALRRRLQDLGADYGDFPVHAGLWDMAEKTAHDPLLRMALVPRTLEARALEAVPVMRDKFRRAGDEVSAQLLESIGADEVGHVARGSRWFFFLGGSNRHQGEELYRQLLAVHMPRGLKTPLNHPARLAAGFSPGELEALERHIATP